MTNILGSIRRYWTAFWFAPESPYNLAVARIIIALHALWILLSRDLAAISSLPGPFWLQVPLGRQLRYLIFPGMGSLEHLLQFALIVLLLAVAFGIRPRLTALCSALLLYHLAPLETVIWTSSPYERGFEVTVISLVVLAISPCADVLSPSASRQPKLRREGWEYGWALRLMQLFVAQIYLFSGYSKLFRAGPEWVSAENLRQWFLVFAQQDQIAVFTRLGLWIADRPALCFLAGIGALAMDFGFITALFFKRIRWIVLPGAVLFHVGILFTLNIAFLNLPQILIFVDWAALRRQWTNGSIVQQHEPANVHALT